MTFRLPIALKHYGGKMRPKIPQWLVDKPADYYWVKVYWATPPWMNKELFEEMTRIYKNRPPGYDVDHIVPLKSPIVCGLNVPWNLQYLRTEENLIKSNHMWPGHPCEPHAMFSLKPEPHQLSLL